MMTEAGTVVVIRGRCARRAATAPSIPTMRPPMKAAMYAVPPNSARKMRVIFATVPTHEATSTMRREELKRKAKPAMPQKLAVAAAANHKGCGSGVPALGVSSVNQVTMVTVNVAVMMTVTA